MTKREIKQNAYQAQRQAAREFVSRDRRDDYLDKVMREIKAGNAEKAGLWAADLASLGICKQLQEASCKA